MITIKLPYSLENDSDKDFISLLRKQQSCVIRYSFNRLFEKYKDTEIRRKIKSELKNIEFIDCWLIDSAILESKTIYSTKKDCKNKVVFGGKLNWTKYNQNKISKDEYKNNKLMKFVCSGEKLQKGNRKFQLDLSNNKIIFKYSRNKHIDLFLPKLKNNYKKQLSKLQELSSQKQTTFSIKLDSEFIYISFEPILSETYNSFKLNNRIMSIDMNPNETGWAILDFNPDDTFKIIDSGVISIEKLNSNKIETKYTNNKRKHELFHIVKFLTKKCKHYQCKKFTIEDLNITNQNHKRGNSYNRLVNNRWNRVLFNNNLSKHLETNGIEKVKVNSAYSSFVGNILYSKNYPDPICSAIEIGRRGFKKFVKNTFYPELISHDNLPDQWKNTVSNRYQSWIELFNDIKKMELRYHFSWKSCPRQYQVFSMNHENSQVECINIL